MVVLLRWKNLGWGPFGIKSSVLDNKFQTFLRPLRGEAKWVVGCMSSEEVFSVLAHSGHLNPWE